MVNIPNDTNEFIDDPEITNEPSSGDDVDIETVESATEDKVKKLRDEVRRLDTEKRALLEDLQRTKADFLNARKRLEEERLRDRERMRMTSAEALLPLCDSFELAMSNREVWEKADATWRKGIEGIRGQLESILRGYGVRSFSPQNEQFDPNRHEALGTVPVNEKEHHERIMSVAQAGYEMTIGDRTELIRPARVTIGTFTETTEEKS